MLRGLLSTLTVILSLSLLASSGDAQDADEGEDVLSEEEAEARVHFEEGSEAFEVGDYERSAEEFRTAYELSRRPALLYNVYSALERGGHLEEAAEALEGYLQNESELDDEQRGPLEARLERLRERIAAERAERAEAERSAPEPVAPEPARTPEDDGGGGVHPAAIGVLVGAGVLLASFGVFAGLAAAENGSLESSCGASCSDDQVSTLSTFNLVADISWIAGATAAAAGIVLLFVLDGGGHDDRARGASGVAPLVSADGIGVGAWGSF